MKLHLGSGTILPEGWVHLDASWNARLAKWPALRKLLGRLGWISTETAAVPWSRRVRIHDLRRPLPFPDRSAEAIYSAHLLDYLYQTEARRLLKECFRVLQPGGILRVSVEEIPTILRDYLEGGGGDGGELPADRLARRLDFYEVRPPPGPFWLRFDRLMNAYHKRKWLYDADSLAHYLREAGFSEVARKPIRESRIGGIEAVERGGGIAVEGVRPG